MNSLLIFTAKEIKEQIRTFKGIIVLAVMLLFGMTSPLLARLTPEMLKMMDVGVKIQMPAPTYLDAYSQFYKNISQMAVLVILLVFAGSVVSETAKGTAQIMLTKRLPRETFVLAKFLCGALVWTISYAASSILCILYTVYLFPEGKPSHLFLSLFCMWLFGMLMIAASILSSSIFKNYALATVGAFLLWIVLSLFSAIPRIKDAAPSALGSNSLGLISNNVTAASMRAPILTASLLILLFLFSACRILRMREI